MPFLYSSFSDHLAALPVEHARHGKALRAAMEQEVRRPSNADISAFLFLPDQTNHPDHGNAAHVFAHAVEDMYGPKPWVGDEIPLLFVGYHAKNWFNGRRTAQGLLLTDQAMYVQDGFNALRSSPLLAQGNTLPSRAEDAGDFVSMLLGRYKDRKGWAALAGRPEATLMNRIHVLLAAAVKTVMNHHAQHASQRQAPQRIWTVNGLIADHAAAGTLLGQADAKTAKKLDKVAGKFQIPADETLQFALVDFPLFGGPYGIALTTKALHSRDLFEAPVRLTLDRLDARSLRLSEKGDEVLNDAGVPLQLTAHASADLKASFIELLKQEVLRLQSTD
ncbi:hypothetical protein N7D90_15845 [Pseudomonas fragi]|uniref:hypothetical protein n=1 Tax=Pseudomonas fragi TaxID=296 RepID=UPI0021BF9F1F|nr:hypothetical protein [Pseudomonas fragi]UXL37053.1 hypothetical protein N7D90_15845 [Pseudomonas fragi]